MTETESAESNAYFVMLMAAAVAILVTAALLARRNLRNGRGDRRGAARLAFCMTAVLLALWVCSVHVVASPALFAMLLLALCTSVFYGALLWTIYMALEPFVRRHWPKVLVSWTSLLSGRITDPVVGRDVLLGVGLGLFFALLIRTIVFWSNADFLAGFPGDMRMLLGVRQTASVVLEELPYAIRNVLLYFFVLFVLRVLLRREWAAVIAFTVFFTALNAMGNDDSRVGALLGVGYFSTAAYVVRRWGLLPFVVGAFVSALLFDIPATRDASAWYFGNMILMLGIVVGLACWAFYTSMAGRIWKTDPFG
jgi:hypothetical protein